MTFDLIIRRAQLRQRGGLTDIGITGGRIAAVETRLPSEGAAEIDAAGRLVTEPFVDCHFHIDKSFFGEAVGRYDYPLKPLSGPGELFEGEVRSGMQEYELLHSNVVPIEHTWAFKRQYTPTEVAERVGRALELALAHGTLAMRMFVDVDSFAGLRALEGVLLARERFGRTMTLQVCAFPQEGLLTNPAAFDLMRQAMDMGADVVGGIPFIELDDEGARRHIDYCFDLAKRYDRDVHMLCDDAPNPNFRTLEMLAAKTIREEYHGRVSSGHNGALRVYPDAHAARVINLVRQARINIVANPNVNALGTLTRVNELMAAGVNVCSGQDDLDNFYYPLGRADLLDSMNFMVHLAHLATPQGFEVAFDIVTRNGARTLGMSGYGLEVGAEANLLIFDGSNLHDVLQMQADRNYVIARGRIVASTTRQRHIELIRE
ncbi:MAG: amidohydrolase family protein [bacterium]|nr:amidohydrolase family protein [bacterium]